MCGGAIELGIFQATPLRVIIGWGRLPARWEHAHKMHEGVIGAEKGFSVR